MTLRFCMQAGGRHHITRLPRRMAVVVVDVSVRRDSAVRLCGKLLVFGVGDVSSVGAESVRVCESLCKHMRQR